MPLENSPSFDHFEPELQDEKTRKSDSGKLKRIIVIFCLIFIMILLFGIKLNLYDPLLSSTDTGYVYGATVDFAGLPVSADMLVVGMGIHGQSDTEGKFILEKIPVGEHVLVIGFQGMGQEISITVHSNTGSDLGTIKLATTAVP